MLTAVEPPLDAKARRLSTPANIKAEPYVPKQRLIIEKLVLRNFKSYAGTVEIGPFHKSFSSIVGPNGSGKSNVIDALLFVFGFKAKKMRQDRLSDLIHNSVGHENLDSCGVEVHFVEIIDKPGTQEYTTVDRTQLIVSRTVEKAKVDKSTYRINGRTSSFTEVTALLKGKGVDLDHKRFLILQGEVESISLMKPKGQTEHEDGLLEYLEDIIGTTKYKVKIDEANTLLDQCNEEREEKLNRLKIVEKDKNALEPRKQEAEEFISLENVVCQKKNKLYQIQKWDLVHEFDELKTNLEAFGVKLKEERASSSGMLTEMEILEKECKKISVDYDKVAKQAESYQNALNKNEKTEIELKEKDKHLKTKQKKLSKTIQQEQFSLSESKSWLANFEGDTRKANLELENLKTRQNEEEKELQAIADSLKGKTEGFKLEIAKKQQELEPWTEKINAKKSGIEVAESELALLEQRASLSDKTIKEAEERIEGFTAALQEKIGLLSEQKKNLRSTKPKYEEIQKQIAALNSEESLRSSLQASRKKLSDLREQRQSFMSRGKVLSEIMNLKESGQVNGICGRLGDLGVIDERFDVAVTTACGSLNSIVVETVKSGEACLAYLKKNNLGRATFLCLDKIRAYDTSPIDTPADSKRLFDLIKIKDRKFAKVFYHALQDTLVTDDLETANKIAYGKKRFRVVTVGGNLIDISGTLSGGGSRPQRGGMSSTFLSADVVSPKVIADAEKEISQMEEELNELLSTKKNLEKLMAAFNAEIPRIESEISKLEMEVASVTQQLEQAKAEKSNAKSSVRKLTKDELARMDRLRGAITSETDQLEDLKKSALKVEAQIAQLQEKILQAGGVKLRSQKAKVDGIMQEIELCGERLINLQVERTTREKSIKKITTSVANKEKELMGIEEELGGIMEALKDVAEDDFKIRKDLLKIKEEYETQERLLTKVKKQQEDMSEAISKFRALERSLTSEIEAYTKKLKDVEKELSHTENRLKKLQLQTTGFENEDSDTVLPTFTEEDLEDFDSAILEKDIKDTQDRLNKMTPNLSVLVEYRQKHDIYLKRAADLEEVTKRRDDAKSTLDDLRKRRLDEFMDGFTAISQKLKEMYQMITLGGNAELELVDTMDPFSEGIIFSVMPPKKSWKNIANLSGGEKTLSSLALVFALHHFKPTPIYFMDEIDAALDFRNVSIVANYIKERTKDAQFIIISLRNNMFELADRLVGIYKTDNTTKSITINPALIPVS